MRLAAACLRPASPPPRRRVSSEAVDEHILPATAAFADAAAALAETAEADCTAAAVRPA